MQLNMRAIGERIKKRRKELQLTQLDIKEKAGISSGNMSDIERGNRLPAASTLVQLSEILNCSVDWILTGKSPKTEIDNHLDLTEMDQKFLNLFRLVSEDDKEEIIMLLELKKSKLLKSKEQEKSSLFIEKDIENEIA